MSVFTGKIFSQINDSTRYTGNLQKIEDWKDARFGMFIHWGPVTLKGTEISWSRGVEVPINEYDSLYLKFNPVNFNADEWVSIAKAAGMKYVVLTTKHHDGFCLWNTRQTDYNIMHTPFNRDVVKELSEACKKQGIRFGAYYSTCDWYNPDFPKTGAKGATIRDKSDLEAYTHYLKRQIAELMLNYGPLEVLWFDVPQMFDIQRGQGVIDFARAIQPDILINDRTRAKGDFDTPEQRIGGFQNTRPWETNMTVARQWSWKPNDDVKSLRQCLQALVRTAGGDGNFLFNISPDFTGRVEPEQVARLKEMGQWLEKYGYSVYGTRGGPFKPTDWGVSTRKDNKIYLHILVWSGNKVQITLPDVGMEIKNCRLVDGGSVKLTKKDKDYVIEFSAKALQPINTIVEMEVEGNAMDIKPLEVKAQSLSFRKQATASSVGDKTWHGIRLITNGDWSGYGWTPAKEDKMPWAEIDLEKPQVVSKAILTECGKAVKAFEVQYLSGETWKTAYKGTSIQSGVEFGFPKITAQKVRLVIIEATTTPEIPEVVFY